VWGKALFSQIYQPFTLVRFKKPKNPCKSPLGVVRKRAKPLFHAVSVRMVAMTPSLSIASRIERALVWAQQPAAQSVFTELFPSEALQQAQITDAATAANTSLGTLHGCVLSLKDNFDVAGQTTLAGGVVCTGEPPAKRDASAVVRLRAAGAVLLGKTNMSEFAFSGVGINPHHGTPANPCDTQVQRVPGGSSSGAAVSVALGCVDVGIGTDTGGSIRIPAALCGLVGFKGTQARIPRKGVMELSRTLDTVGVIGRTVRDVLRVEAVMSQQPLPMDPADLRGKRFAVPQSLVLDDMQPEVAQTFVRTLSRLSSAGAEVVEIAWTSLNDIVSLSQPGGFSPIEGYAAHHQRLARGADQIDPRVVARMLLGQGVSAQDYLGMLDRRQVWIAESKKMLQGFDAVLSPTVPMLAPEIAPLLADDEAFFNVNRLLLRNPSTINFLDGCSWSLPCQRHGDMPVGLMVSAPAGHDAELAEIVLAIEALELGAEK
jgi:aspartyl-tRNA(Asn)/glutamyl-tRNA(Gln) amidotransferase subunit A